jgi:hypothetical protein
MSMAGDLAARVLKLIAQGISVSAPDEMRLRYFAQREEVTLPLEQLARRILEREKESA